MMKKFNLKNLKKAPKEGVLVAEMANGEKFLVLNGIMVNPTKKSWFYLHNYDEDFKNDGNNVSNYNIDRVYSHKSKNNCFALMDDEYLELVWERNRPKDYYVMVTGEIHFLGSFYNQDAAEVDALNTPEFEDFAQMLIEEDVEKIFDYLKIKLGK